MSGSNCYFLTCIQVSQEAGQVVWYAHLFQNFPQFIVVNINELCLKDHSAPTNSWKILQNLNLNLVEILQPKGKKSEDSRKLESGVHFHIHILFIFVLFFLSEAHGLTEYVHRFGGGGDYEL